jgi:hypothetical protein
MKKVKLKMPDGTITDAEIDGFEDNEENVNALRAGLFELQEKINSQRVENPKSETPPQINVEKTETSSRHSWMDSEE